MNFFSRAANGWEIAKGSFKVLNANRSLLVFPLLSGLSLILVLGLMLAGILGYQESANDALFGHNRVTTILSVFFYYLVNYFVIVFFNTALTHCVSMYFNGEPVSVKAGMAHSFTRLPAIFSWAVFAATVGTIINLLQENLGFLGKILTGLIGVVFNIAAFFVVPILAYENLGPVKAFRRSALLMKEKWGETAGASFNFGFVQFIALVFIAIIAITLGTITSYLMGGVFAVVAVLFLITITSAVKAIFTTAVYRNISGDPVEHYEQKCMDNLFITK
jgi:hypothetical protein